MTQEKSQNTNVRIRSHLKFAFTCNNHYTGDWIQIPGSPERMWRQEEADCKTKDWEVYQVEVPVGEKFMEYIYEVTVNPIKGYTFIEDPYQTVGPASYDNNKKMNYHFKNFKKGDQIPLEYIVWQWIHKYTNQISQSNFSLVVTKENFALVQWLLQAIFNDLQQDFCAINPSTLSGLYAALRGEKSLIKMPTDWANSIVGEFNVLESNKEFLEESISKLQKEIEEKRNLLQSAQGLKTSQQFILKPTLTDAGGATITSNVSPLIDQVANLLVDSEDVKSLVEKAAELKVLRQHGAWYELDGNKYGPGLEKATLKFTEDLNARSALKEAMSKQMVTA